jgi:hypothetical protein
VPGNYATPVDLFMPDEDHYPYAEGIRGSANPRIGERTMRITTAILTIGLALVAAPGQAQDFNTLLQGLNRVLNPEEERERAERRSRYEELRRRDQEYDRDRDRREAARYDERYDPREDRFWSEEAQRLGYERMSDTERQLYDRLSERERERYEEDAGYERQQQYERMSDAERRRYDEALEDMHEEIRRERRRSG